jgi:hypothetical protein
MSQIYHLIRQHKFFVRIQKAESIQVSCTAVSTIHSSWKFLLELLTVAYCKQRNEQQLGGQNSKYLLSGSDPTILVTNTKCSQHEEIDEILYSYCISNYAGKIYKY